MSINSKSVMVAAAICAAFVGATGSQAAEIKIGPDQTSLTVNPSESVAAMVPDAYKGGTINIATDPSAPPYTYYAGDAKTLIGSDIDMGNAIAVKLGVKASWGALKFPGIIAAIQAKRFDLAVTSMGDTPAREKQLDFVDYSTDGNAIVVAKGNTLGIKTIADLCGKRVAVLQGSVLQGLVEQQDAKCDSKIDIQVFQDNNQALLQVRTGRADATMYQYGVAAYIIKTSPEGKDLEVLTFETYGTGYNAIPFRKTDAGLRDAVQAALTDMQADGTYKAILSAWGMEAGGIDKITVNDGLRFNQPSN